MSRGPCFSGLPTDYFNPAAQPNPDPLFCCLFLISLSEAG